MPVFERIRSDWRVFVLIGLFAASVGGVLFVPPIPQDLAFHNFADKRTYLGLSNFGDAVSNLGFAIVGFLGLRAVCGKEADRLFADRTEALPYAVFFLGVGLVSIGSSYYHLAPDNDRLFWDRLPITIAFMGLFAGIIADRVDRRADVRWLLPVLILLGGASLLYWDWTEGQGRGDLRFYGLVQFYPIMALPVICWLFPKGRLTNGVYLIWVVVWYGVAKFFEHFDAEVFDFLGGTVSGHSLKHIAAAVAAYIVLRMITAQSNR